MSADEVLLQTREPSGVCREEGEVARSGEREESGRERRECQTPLVSLFNSRSSALIRMSQIKERSKMFALSLLSSEVDLTLIRKSFNDQLLGIKVLVRWRNEG